MYFTYLILVFETCKAGAEQWAQQAELEIVTIDKRPGPALLSACQYFVSPGHVQMTKEPDWGDLDGGRMTGIISIPNCTSLTATKYPQSAPQVFTTIKWNITEQYFTILKLLGKMSD